MLPQLVNNNVRDVVITHELSKRRWKEEPKKNKIKNGIDEDKQKLPNTEREWVYIIKIQSMQSRGREYDDNDSDECDVRVTRNKVIKHIWLMDKMDLCMNICLAAHITDRLTDNFDMNMC